MPTAGKVFVSTEYKKLADIAASLEGHKLEEEYAEGDFKLTLLTEVANVNVTEGVLTGLYSYDHVVYNYHRGKVLPAAATKEILFSMNEHENRVYLVVVDKKAIANRIANKLSEIAFGEMGVIVEARILPETMKFHHNKEGTGHLFRTWTLT
jgi:hypothetical protein